MSWTCWDRIYGLPQSGRRGFGKFYHMRHGKIMSGFNKREVPKFLGFSFKRKTNPKNLILRRGQTEERFLITNTRVEEDAKIKTLSKGKKF